MRRYASLASSTPPITSASSVSGERRRTPIFRMPHGAVWATCDVEKACKDAARAIDLDPDDHGGVSIRIGGATDFRACYGLAGRDLITARGRWADEDIGFIYQRVTAVEQLEAAAALADGGAESAPELEVVLSGWSQPAVRRA